MMWLGATLLQGTGVLPAHCWLVDHHRPPMHEFAWPCAFITCLIDLLSYAGDKCRREALQQRGCGMRPAEGAVLARVQAWRQGRTGYPLVDAGLRELWSTGWMHNRSRVICASFLVKNLLLPWQWGLKHYWDAQLDADLESDALGWQYVSGCLAGALAWVRICYVSSISGCWSLCRPLLFPSCARNTRLSHRMHTRWTLVLFGAG